MSLQVIIYFTFKQLVIALFSPTEHYLHTTPADRKPITSKNKRQNYYAILGVDSTATQAQIRSAYYTKCKETHPDAQPSGAPPIDPGFFIDVVEAYAILGDPELRRDYDMGNAVTSRVETRPSSTAQSVSVYFTRETMERLIYSYLTILEHERKPFLMHPAWPENQFRSSQ